MPLEHGILPGSRLLCTSTLVATLHSSIHMPRQSLAHPGGHCAPKHGQLHPNDVDRKQTQAGSRALNISRIDADLWVPANQRPRHLASQYTP